MVSKDFKPRSRIDGFDIGFFAGVLVALLIVAAAFACLPPRWAVSLVTLLLFGLFVWIGPRFAGFNDPR